MPKKNVTRKGNKKIKISKKQEKPALAGEGL